jgi:membrane protease YdiL (CAAX protease family)
MNREENQFVGSSVKKNLLEMALLFLAFYLPGYLWPGAAASGSSLGAYMLRFLAAAVPQILLLLYLLRLRSPRDPSVRSPWAEFGLRRLRAADLLYALLIFSGILLLLLLWALILNLLPAEVQAQFTEGFRWKLEGPRLIPLALLFCLVTGYREELFFRAYLITRLCQLRLPAAAAIAASTVLFAGGHVYQGIAGFAVAAIQGAYFAVLFVRLKNVHPLAVAHGLYNTTVLVLSLFYVPGLPGALLECLAR